MKRIILFLACTLSLASLCSYCQQTPAAENNSAPPVFSEHPDKKAEPVIPEVLFGGGPVSSFIEALRTAGRKAGLAQLNVIVPEEMQDQSVPPLELHNVRYADVFQALNQLNPTGAGSNWHVSMSAESSIWVLAAPPHAVNWDPKTGRAMQIDPLTGQPLVNGEPPKNCQIYQLQRYLTKYKVEDITTAIHTAWEMLGTDKGTELKYHKDTSLLIAVGQPDQLEIISRVLHSLDEGLFTKEGPHNVTAEVFVNGAVNKPGVVRIAPEENLDILGALARAGGLTTRASESRIKFTRPGVLERTVSLEDLKKGSKNNVSLQAGDIIEVLERIF